MIQLLATLLALLLAPSGSDRTLLRKERDDTIYLVRGSIEQLAKFQGEVGSRWQGGKLLMRNETDGLYRYWAYPDRTASQSREFMFGAMASGLYLDIIAYDERFSFRAERSSLDEIAISCGLSKDPFFITPIGELQVSFDGAEPQEAISCATQKMKNAPLPNLEKGRIVQ